MHGIVEIVRIDFCQRFLHILSTAYEVKRRITPFLNYLAYFQGVFLQVTECLIMISKTRRPFARPSGVGGIKVVVGEIGYKNSEKFRKHKHEQTNRQVSA